MNPDDDDDRPTLKQQLLGMLVVLGLFFAVLLLASALGWI